MTSEIFDEVSIDREVKSLAEELNVPEEKVREVYMKAINELNNKAKMKDYIHVLIKKDVKEK